MNEAIISFFSARKKLTFKKGEIIIRPNDLSSNVYYLKYGYVRQYTVSENGEEFTVIIFKPGDIFPLGATAQSTNRNYYFESINLSTVYISSESDFYANIQNETISEHLFKEIIQRFYGVIERIEHMAFGNAQSRVASIIQICGQRFGKQIKNGIIIQVPLTHRLVASLVGISRETASIEIKKLEREGIISYSTSRKIVIIRQIALKNKALHSE